MAAPTLADQMTQNAQARQIILQNAVPVIQKIASVTQAQGAYVAGQATVLNIPLQNVGLIKRIWVDVVANVQQGAAETQNATILGGSNALSQVLLTDLNNLVRINTSGWHLALLGTARRQLAAGAAFTSDTPFGIGSNYLLNKTPSAVTGAANLYQSYELPLAYSDSDLRGAIFANVVNATMNLQLTLNPNFFVSSTGDSTGAVYQSTTAQLGKINSYTIEVYQEYLDQLPRDGANNFILPGIDLSTQYNLLNSTTTGLAVGADQTLTYANFRSYLSTFVMYDNGGVLNAGTDLNYISLVTANSMNLFKLNPRMLQLLNGRNKINDDWPKGIYYIPHRDRPISTLQFGNMALNVNPSTVNANAMLSTGYEFFANQNQLQSAGTIASS
jgi:hypothetical protein